MVGHLKEQVIIYNHAKRLGDIQPDKFQKTIDDFNAYTRHGGKMLESSRQERMLLGLPTGWTSIDSATEAVLKQDWMEERGVTVEPTRVIPVRSRKVIQVNRHGRPIMINGKRVVMTFELRPPRNKPHAKPRWILRGWKYAS
jgi:hypothetical protein